LNKNKDEKVPFMIKDGDFPKIGNDKSVIAICIGTGIAPIRNLLWEQYSEINNDNPNENGKKFLFYGCRSKDTDFLYSTELLQFENDKCFK